MSEGWYEWSITCLYCGASWRTLQRTRADVVAEVNRQSTCWAGDKPHAFYDLPQNYVQIKETKCKTS